MQKWIAGSLFILLTLLSGASLSTVLASGERLSETASPAVLGQLLVSGASLDGTNVPTGSTVFSGSLITTRSEAAAVHLKSGQVVELGSHSSAVFEKLPSGEVRVSVRTGNLRFRGEDGNLRIAGPDDSVWFAQRRAGRPIFENQEGVVAVLAQVANSGQQQLVVKDASKVEPSSELLIRAQDGRYQELKCSIEDIRDQVVTVDRELRFTFQPEDLLLQRLPVAESRVYSMLTQAADGGDDQLKVSDAKQINPLERIEIRHPSRQVREAACVQFTRGSLAPAGTGAAADQTQSQEEIIKLFRGLRNGYPPDAEIRQGTQIDKAVRTRLSQPAREGSNVLQVADADAIDPLLQVMIRSEDGSRFEAYCVAAVEDDRVILAEDLAFDYPAGSDVMQGKAAGALIDEGVILQRVANCCCCCGGAAGLPFAWWWFIPPAAGAATAIGIATTGEEPPIDCDLFPTPTAPPECRVP